jgi:hypothetical protein
VNVLFVLDQFIAQQLLEVSADFLQPGNAIDHIAG